MTYVQHSVTPHESIVTAAAALRAESVRLRALSLILLISGCSEALLIATPGITRPGTAADSVGPLVHFPTESLDLGRIKVIRNTPYRAAFRLENRGDEVLILEKIRISCGCVSAVPDQTMILPGESAAILVSARADQPGRRSVTVTVESNSSTRPAVPLRIQWEAIDSVQFEPPEVQFGVVREGATLRQQVTVAATEFAGHTEQDPEFDNGRTGFLRSSRTAPDQVTIELTAGQASGDHRDFITVHLDNDDTNVLHIPVTWSVQPDIRCQPTTGFAGSVRPGQQLSVAFVLTGDGQPVEVDDTASLVVGDHPLTVSCDPIGTDRVRVVLSGTAPLTPGPFHLPVRLPLRQPAGRSVSTAVSGYVIDASPDASQE